MVSKRGTLHGLALMTATVVAVGSGSSRANAPAGRYTVGGGKVVDNKTGLTWQQSVSSTMYTVAEGKTYCASLGASLGGTGWRLPTIKELMTLVDYSQATGPYIDTTAFTNLPTGIAPFWTATAVASAPTKNWVVFFTYGTCNDIEDAGSPHPVLCVR